MGVFQELISGAVPLYACLTRPFFGGKNPLSSTACGDSGPSIVCGGVCVCVHVVIT